MWDDPVERQRLLLASIVVAYVFVLGATLGSFLNVVIYRLPRGLNIVRPRSRCTCCGTPIELRDNIPVLSWLRLRGCCRICGAPISARYVLVETAVGVLFVGLTVVHVFTGGANLPLRPPTPHHEIFLGNWSAAGYLFGVSLYHASLITTLLVAALIQFDRLAVPGSLWRAALAIGLLAPVVWPSLRLVPAFSASFGPPWSSLVDGAEGLMLGAALGAVYALPAGRQLRSLQLPAGHWLAAIAAFALIGAYLGWQATVAIAAMSTIGMLLISATSRVWPEAAGVPPLVWPLVASLLHVVAWRPLVESSWSWPGPQASIGHTLAWLVVAAVACLIATAITPAKAVEIASTEQVADFPPADNG